jgi:outer membrane protein assembly factor BamB
LLYDGKVFVATEDDDVFALDASTGRTLWEKRLGSPLVDVISQAGCGDIDPLGVTSTPVIDTATRTLYVLGELSNGGRTPVHHELFGLDLTDGAVTSSVDADPPLLTTANAVHLLQRAALALGNGRIYIGYGGQYGDCGSYHGWVVSVPVAGGVETAFDVTPTGTGGAVWDGGSGPALGANGDVYVTTGNPNSSAPAPWAESVVKLPGALSPVPLAWFRDPAATGDMDLSTGGPILLPDGDVFAVGKTDIGYLLRQANLSQVAPIAGRVCSSDPDGGGAWDPATDSVYVPCRAGGIQQVDLSAMRTGWHAGSSNSTVVLAGAGLWSLRYPTGTLEELDPSNGAVLYKLDVGRRVPNFASPAVLDGLVVVPTDSGVAAFAEAGAGTPAKS